MNKYKSGSGWHNQSVRHSNARRFGKAGGQYVDELQLRRSRGIEPNDLIMERLYTLPLRFTDDTIYLDVMKKDYTSHLISEPTLARQYFFSMIKKDPAIIGIIEQFETIPVIITSKKLFDEDGKQIYGQARKNSVIMSIPLDLRQVSTEGRNQILNGIQTTFHEFRHVQQYQKFPEKKIEAMSRGRYEQRPLEKDAESYAEKRMGERFRKTKEITSEEIVQKEKATEESLKRMFPINKTERL